jgi:hypothetical protein
MSPAITLPVPPAAVAFDWLFASSAEAETTRFNTVIARP